ncbi:MAG: hypothetical protein RR559_11420, partial [Bacteroides sp.]
PSLHLHYRGFDTTTGLSASKSIIATITFTYYRSRLSLSISTWTSPVPCKSLHRAPATYTPAATRTAF